jgi:hypothetical protein
MKAMAKDQREASMTVGASQTAIVTLAVFLAGGASRAVDTEDVAIKANEIAPGRFAWRKYPDQINLELVRVYLSDAKKEAKGAWLAGSGRQGWLLTSAGLTWSKRNAKRLLKRSLTRRREQSRAGSIDENRWRRERERILATSAWRKWSKQAPNITAHDAAEVFRIDSYAVGQIKYAKITRARAMFDEDAKVSAFLARMASLLNEEEQEP